MGLASATNEMTGEASVTIPVEQLNKVQQRSGSDLSSFQTGFTSRAGKIKTAFRRRATTTALQICGEKWTIGRRLTVLRNVMPRHVGL